MKFVVFLLCTNPVAWRGFRTMVAVKNHHFAVLSRIGRSFNAEKGYFDLVYSLAGAFWACEYESCFWREMKCKTV